MVCTMVCLVHLMRGHKKITGTVTYSNEEYHHVVNVLNFKTALLKKSHVSVYVVFWLFYFQPLFIIFEILWYDFVCEFSSLVFFEKNPNYFATALNLKFDLVEKQSYMQLAITVLIIFCLMRVFILGVKELRKKIFLHTLEAHSNMTQ